MRLSDHDDLKYVFRAGTLDSVADVLLWNDRISAYGRITKKSLIAFYISGAPVDLVQATSTVIFLWILSRPLLEKLERVKRKYGLLQRPENKEENENDKE